MSALPFSLHQIAHRLGGQVAAGQISCPGPGHSKRDRSMTVRLSQTDADGFVVHSHAGDDFRDCRDHVRSRLGLARKDRRREAMAIAPAAMAILYPGII